MLGKFRNYLLTIAVNTCNNYFKKTKPAYTDLESLDIADEADSSFEKMIRDENKLEVRRAVNALPGYQKEVIILRFYHELKIREIAKVTGASIPTVKSRLQQGIKKLRRCLDDFKESENV